MATKQWAGEWVCGEYATLSGARAAARTADQKFYGGPLTVRVRPSAEWARIGIDKDEFVLIKEETS